MKDIRSSLASALSESHDGGSSQQLDDVPSSLAERQSIGAASTPGGMGSTQSFGTYKPRSIRRLMSEKSMTMDTVYSGALLDETPSEPLEVCLLAEIPVLSCQPSSSNCDGSPDSRPMQGSRRIGNLIF